MVFTIKYPNDNTEYKVSSFDEIKSNCIYLNCIRNNLTSLEGIENLTQLQELNCSKNELRKLPNLDKLVQKKVKKIRKRI
jgi:Leucine-rich repeat (LRR) protein